MFQDVDEMGKIIFLIEVKCIEASDLTSSL